ncbi:CPBP family intramembrane glutamic endopeptidase [uncultured Agrococcus sp.]|uniref:CPBP family intramembrane glutamic endopeptidase n=1 Tax=uncultured Agrococcus sp. TaxID=382258 RepID=UPI0025E97105|nr:CPBP family intramembrane glutamic endopeptidase [uncultured Agrococcus sp.]
MSRAELRGYGVSLVLFVIVTIAATYGLQLVEAAYAIGGGAIQWHHFGPLIGAAVTSLIVPATSRPEPPQPVGRRQWVAHTILGVAAAAVFALLVWIGFGLLHVTAPDLGRAGAGTVVIAMLGGLLGAAAQEVGWRGFLQPTLESRMPRIGASVIVGLVWSLWYVNAFTDIVTGILLFATYVPLSILLGHLGNGSIFQRVLTTAIVHWLITLPVTFLGGIAGSVVQFAVALASIAATTMFMVMFVIATKRRRAKTAANSTDAQASSAAAASDVAAEDSEGTAVDGAPDVSGPESEEQQ